MLSLLTYGATLGVAEVANTRHERNHRRSQKHSQNSSQKTIDSFNDRSSDRTSTEHSIDHSTKRPREAKSEHQTKHSLNHQITDSPSCHGEFQAKRRIEQEQHATKGGVGGWLRRLIQH